MGRRAKAIGAAFSVVAGMGLGLAAGPDAQAAPGCGPLDRPETGIAGEVPLADQISGRADDGYSCGLSLIGYTALGGRGGNANMAWAGHCAYVAGDGVAVVDVRDPQRPVHVRTLRGAGADETVETLHAVDAPDRSILVTGRYGVFGWRDFNGPAPIDVWDVSDCAEPVHLSTVTIPWNAHNLTLSADGRRLWNTLPLSAVDLSDPRNPVPLGNLEEELAAAGAFKMMYAHEAWPSPDGTRLYVGGQMAVDEELLVLDVDGWPARPARVVGRVASPGHSIRPATIDGVPYLVNSDESIVNPTAKGCVPEPMTPVGGASQPYLTDISDETDPVVRSQLRLPINEPENCLRQIAAGVNASVHYHDVDDPDDTTFVMASMWNAGLRIFDVRDPLAPREVAYFNPGRFPVSDPGGGTGVGQMLAFQTPNQLDQAWAHSRYDAKRGHIWLTTRSGGFWVLELQPQLRRALDLPARRAVHPDGGPPRPPETRLPVATALPTGPYCVLDPLGTAITRPL
ncbi:MAG: LVIVD repeat-containing protein [Acidimicrobiia bacterium]